MANSVGFPQVQIGRRVVGEEHFPFVVAEIGINHNGSLELALEMVRRAARAGADAVKFQKRTVDVVYTPQELAAPRESPFGRTNGDLKRGLELGEAEYREIATAAHDEGIEWLASPWDIESVHFLDKLNPAAYKIASACVTDLELIMCAASHGKPVILSTGMSTMEEVARAVGAADEAPLVIMSCTASYPCALGDLHLNKIDTLMGVYGETYPIGYSGHEVGLATSVAAVALGASVIERHFTLDRSMWGSDQSSSIEPQGLARLVRDCRDVWVALGEGKICRLDCELPAWNKLRRVK